MPGSLFERRGRETKARAIADFLWKNTPRELRSNPKLEDEIAAMPEPDRASAGVQAGYKKCPSRETWARVVRLIREKVAEERHWAGLEERVG